MTEKPPPPLIVPGRRVAQLSDFDEASALLFGLWRGRLEQITRGRFAATIQMVRGEAVRLVAIEANQRVLLRGQDAAGSFSVYPVTEANAASHWQGRRLTSGQLVVHGVAAEVNHLSARRTECLGLSLRPAMLEEAARHLLASDGVALPQTWAVVSPPPEAFGALGHRLAGLLGQASALRGTPDAHRLEQECIRSLVAALFHSPAPPDRLTPAGRARVVRHAEDLMRARLGDPLGAIDLCRELRVSDRTLRLAFHEQFGLGPMAYYKCLRLNAVRSLLKAAPAGTVSEAARTYGFHHLGHFAAEYRRLFGAPPSVTLRRRGGGTGPPLGEVPAA